MRIGVMTKEAALDTLSMRHGADLVFFVDVKLGRGPEVAQDAARMAWNRLSRELDGFPAEEESVLPWLCRAAGREAFRADLRASLTPEQRSLILLRGELGLTLEQIGERLGVPPDTVKSRLNEIRKILHNLGKQWKVI